MPNNRTFTWTKTPDNLSLAAEPQKTFPLTVSVKEICTGQGQKRKVYQSSWPQFLPPGFV